MPFDTAYPFYPAELVILASGENNRWKKGRKELADIGGETCIKRLVRQSLFYVSRVTLVTHVQEIMAEFPNGLAVEGVNLVNLTPDHRRWKVESLYHVMADFPQQLIILLGDVIYGRETMDAIMGEHNALTFYGNEGEIFAVVVPVRANLFFWEKVRKALVYAQEHPKQYDVGHLWNIYRAATGRNQVEHADPPETCPHFRYVTDWTNDIDSPTDYALFKQEVIDKGLLDA